MVIDIENSRPEILGLKCAYTRKSQDEKRASWILWISSDGSGQLFYEP
jgi:hypothetical protein